MIRRIEKPWGFEEVIALTDRYCFKRLTVHAGHKTSLQYHKHKHETMYYISGKGIIEIHSCDGKVDRYPIESGRYMVIEPLTIHRVIAEEDTLYLEASTPELSDVVRLQDDYQRI